MFNIMTCSAANEDTIEPGVKTLILSPIIETFPRADNAEECHFTREGLGLENIPVERFLGVTSITAIIDFGDGRGDVEVAREEFPYPMRNISMKFTVRGDQGIVDGTKFTGYNENLNQHLIFTGRTSRENFWLPEDTFVNFYRYKDDDYSDYYCRVPRYKIKVEYYVE